MVIEFFEGLKLKLHFLILKIFKTKN